MGKARITAFLLREVYEGNVINAQRKIYNEYVVSGKKIPHHVAGLREILDVDNFDPEMPILNRTPEKYAGPVTPPGRVRLGTSSGWLRASTGIRAISLWSRAAPKCGTGMS